MNASRGFALLITAMAGCLSPEPNLTEVVAVGVAAIMQETFHPVEVLDSTDAPANVSIEEVGDRVGLPVRALTFECPGTFSCTVTNEDVDVFIRLLAVRPHSADSVHVEIKVYDLTEITLIRSFIVTVVSKDGRWKVIDTIMDTEV